MKIFQKIFFALLLTVVSVKIYAVQPIQVIWAFAPGSNQANTVRQIIAEANKIQNKYEFQFVNKPGAGGHIAATEVSRDPQNSVLAMSSSFFIRPYFEKTSPVHDLDRFTPVLVQGVGAPLIFVSKKYSSLETAIKDSKLTIGVSGIGSISHLAANELLRINKNAVVVNFKSMIEAATAAAGGHVDVAVSFYIDSKGLIDSDALRVIGRTGETNLPTQFGTSITSIGSKDSTKITANYAIFASKEMQRHRLDELHDILSRANEAPEVKQNYQKDQLTPVKLNMAESEVWYKVERRFWSDAVAKLSRLPQGP